MRIDAGGPRMTAMNLIVQPKRRAAFLLSDAAYTRPDGRVSKLAGKTIVFERFPAAVGVTGIDIVSPLGAELRESDPRNIRSLLSMLPRCVDRALAAFVAVHPDEFVGGGVLLKIAAYSARERRPAGYLFASNQSMASSCGLPEHGKAFEASSGLTGFAALDMLGGDPKKVEDPAFFDADQHSRLLVEAQRNEPQIPVTAGVDSTVAYRIGGWAELTEVTRKGVKVWRCGEPWPDKIGERINPVVC